MQTRHISALLVLLITSDTFTFTTPKLPKYAQMALVSGAVLCGGYGVFKLNNYIQRKRVITSLNSLEKEEQKLTKKYTNEIALFESCENKSDSEIADTLAAIIDAQTITNYQQTLTQDIFYLCTHLQFLTHKKSYLSHAKNSDDLANAQIAKAEKLLANLQRIETHLIEHQDYFVTHTGAARAYLKKVSAWLANLKNDYQSLEELDAIDIHSEAIAEKELAHVTSCLWKNKKSFTRLVPEFELLHGMLNIEVQALEKYILRFNATSSLYVQAQQALIEAQKLQTIFAYICNIMAHHASYIKISFALMSILEQYTELPSKMTDKRIHSYVNQLYTDTNITYPYINFVDEAVKHKKVLEQVMPEAGDTRQFDSMYKKLHEHTQNTYTALDDLVKCAVTSSEYQRQKEVKKNEETTQALINSQTTLSQVQQEQNKLESQRIELEAKRIHEMRRTNDITETHNVLKVKENNLKELLLQEALPQKQLLVEMRDVLREIHANPDRTYSDMRLERIIEQLKIVHKKLQSAGMKFEEN